MANEPEDVQATEKSSTSAEATESQVVEGAESTTAESTATETEQSLGNVVAEAARESLKREASAESQAPRTEEEQHEEKSGEETEAKPDVAKEAESAKQDSDVPKEFAKHPAWQRIMRERDEARVELTKASTLAKAQDDLYSYCRQNRITEQQFKEGLNIVSLINTNPAKAYELLQPTIARLEAHLGVRLPDDLQKKVSEGVLDPETAKEVARLRSEREFGKSTAQATEAERAADNIRAMVDGLNAWDKNKTTSDADFEKKRAEVMERYLFLLNETNVRGQKVNNVRTPQEAVALAERALSEVDSRRAGWLPKPGPRKAPLSHKTASGGNGKVEPKTTLEAVGAMLREKHGIEID